MKYKPKVGRDRRGIYAYIEEGRNILYIYDSWFDNHDWPKGFWDNPEYNDIDVIHMNNDYHEHRDEYIAEIKKLLVKEML